MQYIWFLDIESYLNNDDYNVTIVDIVDKVDICSRYSNKIDIVEQQL